MKDERGRTLHDPPQFHESWGHHGEIGHHVGLTKVGSECLQRIGQPPSRLDHHEVDPFRLLIPVPRVLESNNLRSGPTSISLLEENVVILLAIERGVKVDEVYLFFIEVSPHNVEIVPVE